MLDQLFGIVFFPFSLEIVQYCCAFSLVVGLFGVIRHFVSGNFTVGD